MIGAVTVDELAAELGARGRPIGRAALRYHCRDPRGALFGVAYLSGRTWMIPAPAAATFAAEYVRYGSLRKTAPAQPPCAGADPEPHPV